MTLTEELVDALTAACDEVEGTVQCESQHADFHDDPDWKRAQEWRALIAKAQPANPVHVGRIEAHGPEWLWFQLDRNAEALRKGDRIRVRPVSEEWPFRTGISVVLGVMGSIVHLERGVWRDIAAVADMDHVYLVGRDA